MNTRRHEIFAAVAMGMKGRLEVKAAAADSDPTEILLIGPVGASYWSDEGIREKEVIAAIDAVPSGKRIVLGINSPGGSVQEGLGIYNAIKRRAGDITARIDGYACSIASVFPLAAGNIVSPKSAVWMIHNPWVGTVGDANEHRRSIAMLEANEKVLAAIYSEHTGHSRDECRAAMAQETWMTGEEASEWGLATETNDDAVTLAEIKESPFCRIPAALRAAFGKPSASIAPFAMFRRQTPAPISNANNQQQTMNRTAILAALKKHGVKIEDNATDEKLLAEVWTLVVAGKITSAEMASYITSKTTDGNTPAPAPAPAVVPAPAPVAATDPTLVNRIADLERVNAGLRRAEVERVVDAGIRERRIPAAVRKTWVERGVRGDDIAAEIASFPQQLPGEAPVVEITAESPESIEAGIMQLREPMEAVCRGNRVSPAAIQRNAVAITKAVRAGGERFRGALNATTIASDLKRIALMAGDGLMAFKRRILPVRIFSTVFQNVPLEGTNEVAVPYLPLFTTAAVNFVQGTGYQFAANRQIDSRKVTVNKRKYQPFEFNSAELNRQPYFNLVKFIEQGAEQLAVDVFGDIATGITIANFANVAKAELPDSFTTDDVIDIRAACNALNWPTVGRALVLDDPYETALLKDSDLKNADKSGSDAALRNGSIGSIAGFREIYANNNIPTNSEGLRGFATLPSAMLVALAPIMPGPGVRKQLVSYDVVTDPDTGLSFEYRYWGDATQDVDREVIECNYGFAAGEGAALLRITNPS